MQGKLWGHTSGNVWHSCLCFFHLRQSMFLFSNLFKLWNFYYIYSCLHWPFENGMIISVTVWWWFSGFFTFLIFKTLHFLNLCPIFVVLFYFENVCFPIICDLTWKISRFRDITIDSFKFQSNKSFFCIFLGCEQLRSSNAAFGHGRSMYRLLWPLSKRKEKWSYRRLLW